jgi:hypothetical protein
MKKRTFMEQEIVKLLNRQHICTFEEILWGVESPHPATETTPQVVHALSSLMSAGVICGADSSLDALDYSWLLAEGVQP